MKLNIEKMSQREQKLALDGIVALRKAAEALLAGDYDKSDKLMSESDRCYKELEKKVLTLPVTKKWFDKISSGEKTEEYREIKLYWMVRLFPNHFKKKCDGRPLSCASCMKATLQRTDYDDLCDDKFTHVRFTNGYPKGGEPYIEKEIVSIAIGKPKPGLCPKEFENKDYFIIKFK